MLIDIPEEIVLRLHEDAKAIRAPRERLGTKEDQPLRWQPPEENPNGWRTMGDLAADLEIIMTTNRISS